MHCVVVCNGHVHLHQSLRRREEAMNQKQTINSSGKGGWIRDMTSSQMKRIVVLILDFVGTDVSGGQIL